MNWHEMNKLINGTYELISLVCIIKLQPDFFFLQKKEKKSELQKEKRK